MILRLHVEKEDIVEAFDVDCCGVLYDGSDVLATPRAIAALSTRTNIVDYSRRSWSYEARLIKYARRGFSIGAPKLRRGEVELRDSSPRTRSRSELPEEHPLHVASHDWCSKTGESYAEWSKRGYEHVEASFSAHRVPLRARARRCRKPQHSSTSAAADRLMPELSLSGSALRS